MKITKSQLRRIIKEEILEGYQEERAKAAAATHFKPSPQFPKMTYPEDRAKAQDPAVALEGIVKAIQHARTLGVSEYEIDAAVADAVRSGEG